MHLRAACVAELAIVQPVLEFDIGNAFEVPVNIPTGYLTIASRNSELFATMVRKFDYLCAIDAAARQVEHGT